MVETRIINELPLHKGPEKITIEVFGLEAEPGFNFVFVPPPWIIVRCECLLSSSKAGLKACDCILVSGLSRDLTDRERTRLVRLVKDALEEKTGVEIKSCTVGKLTRARFEE